MFSAICLNEKFYLFKINHLQFAQKLGKSQKLADLNEKFAKTLTYPQTYPQEWWTEYSLFRVRLQCRR